MVILYTPVKGWAGPNKGGLYLSDSDTYLSHGPRAPLIPNIVKTHLESKSPK